MTGYCSPLAKEITAIIRCPYSHVVGGNNISTDDSDGIEHCSLYDGVCLLVSGMKCQTYIDWLDDELQKES